MKKIFIVLLLTISTTMVLNATKHALVIGIGPYPTETGWTAINGDKDIPIVEKMLLSNGFLPQDIVALENQNATADAIHKELRSLVTKAQVGDIIYIHFSGHGQRITDISGDEEDGFDEAWIAYDAQFAYADGVYEGENHILDDQLNDYLHQIREKVGENGKITVVADACHSGSATRDIESEQDTMVIRGASDDFLIPNKFRLFVRDRVQNIEWIVISACKSYQCNYEYNGAGSLTYVLSLQADNLATTPAPQMARQIKAAIVNVLQLPQTPVIETPTSINQQTIF